MQSGPPNINMKYSTVEEAMASFPHPFLPPVEGEPDYQAINATRNFIQANSQAIETHLGGEPWATWASSSQMFPTQTFLHQQPTHQYFG
jgi:hypothetical protein